MLSLAAPDPSQKAVGRAKGRAPPDLLVVKKVLIYIISITYTKKNQSNSFLHYWMESPVAEDSLAPPPLRLEMISNRRGCGARLSLPSQLGMDHEARLEDKCGGRKLLKLEV